MLDISFSLKTKLDAPFPVEMYACVGIKCVRVRSSLSSYVDQQIMGFVFTIA